MVNIDVAMTEFISRLKRNSTFIIKIILVLSFPLVASVHLPYFEWISILLVVSNFSIVQFTSFLSVFIGLIIMLPCIIFEYHLNSRPITKSLRYHAITASFLSWLLSVYFPFDILFPSIVLRPDFYAAYYPTNSGLVLAITFFIVLPLITRESIMNNTPNELRSLDYSLIKSSIGRKIRRERVLPGLIWFGLMFCPFMAFPLSYMYDMQFMYWSIFFQYTPYSAPYLALQIAPPYFAMQLTALPAAALPFFLLFSAIRFVFIRDVLRFKIARVTKSRLVSVAILGEILPAATITLIDLILNPGFTLLIFPTPILPIIGFVYLRFSKAIPIKDEIWDEQANRMWFEKEQEPYITQPADESIKVPIAYLLVSQVRRLLGSDEELCGVEN